jgi:hypothetical protein
MAGVHPDDATHAATIDSDGSWVDLVDSGHDFNEVPRVLRGVVRLRSKLTSIKQTKRQCNSLIVNVPLFKFILIMFE